MKTGFTTKCFTGLETEEALSKISGSGAEICGVGLRTFYEYRPEFAKKFASNAGGTRINSVSVSPRNFEYQLFSESRRVRGDGFYWLDQILRSAQIFGAKYYVFRGAPQSGSYDETAARINEISEFCQRFGVTLCLENDPKGLCCRPNVFGELKRRCQSIAAVFNSANAKKSRHPYQAYLVETGAHLAEVRLAPGGYGRVIGDLKKSGFDGAVLLDGEVCDPAQESERINNFIRA